MLQQTRVSTVVSYWRKWMDTFPTINDLACAPVELVLECWAGLGYYRRATALHCAAKEVVSRFEGVLPSDVSLLRSLSGIGPYTAGAIASIAFNAPVPVVDGNVMRVLARLTGWRAVDVKSAADMKHCWKLASELVHPTQPGDFNQALMDLGSLVCTPHAAECEVCPLRGPCRSRSLLEDGIIPQIPGVIPPTASKSAPKEQEVTVCVVYYQSGEGRSQVPCANSISSASSLLSFLLFKRPAEGLLASMWEFPSTDAVAAKPEPKRRKVQSASAAASSSSTSSSSTLAAVLGSLGRDADVAQAEFCGEVVHRFSHILMTLRVHCVAASATTDVARFSPRTARWVTEGAELESVALSTQMRKVLRMAQAHLAAHRAAVQRQ
eukprot:NODE_1273_length_1609_cov_31.040385_g1138_i0.p1 GENE.NODE_1273_length_1609_cov_31.040385_g1138_i0~~NODE_1273_length_1609_cov_31.040385_g1138_i0.p1  ORF type:complete len:380 (+),score=49.21 NODE_1273_length_1609_cov_31.040385_g1138_i0:240-1379(+)